MCTYPKDTTFQDPALSTKELWASLIQGLKENSQGKLFPHF